MQLTDEEAKSIDLTGRITPAQAECQDSPGYLFMRGQRYPALADRL